MQADRSAVERTRRVKKRSLEICRVGFLILLAACSGYKTSRDAQEAEIRGNWDQAVLAYLELVDQEPDNVQYRQGLLRAKMKASQMHFERAKELHEAGALIRRARSIAKRSNSIPAINMRRSNWRRWCSRSPPKSAWWADPTIAEMREATRGAGRSPRSSIHVRTNRSLSVFRDPFRFRTSTRRSARPLGSTSFSIRNFGIRRSRSSSSRSYAQDALEILMRSTKHFYKVVDEHTIIVVEDNPQNRRAYEDLVIQTFFLSNAETKDVMTMLRSSGRLQEYRLQ